MTRIGNDTTLARLTEARARLQVRADAGKAASETWWTAKQQATEARGVAVALEKAYEALQAVPARSQLADAQLDATIAASLVATKAGVDAALLVAAQREQAAAAIAVPDSERYGPSNLIHDLDALLSPTTKSAHVSAARAGALAAWFSTMRLGNQLRSYPTLASSLDPADVAQHRANQRPVLIDLSDRAEKVFACEEPLSHVIDASPLFAHPANAAIANMHLPEALEAMAEILSGPRPDKQASNWNPLFNYIHDRRDDAVACLRELATKVRNREPNLAKTFHEAAERHKLGWGETATLSDLLSFLGRLVTEYGAQAKAEQA